MATCGKCNQIVTPNCDDTLCDIVVPAKCVSVELKECLQGVNLQEVLENICSPEIDCEEVKKCIGINKEGNEGFVLNQQGEWVSITQSTDADWFVAETTDSSYNITDNIYTQGSVGINTNSPNYNLEIIGNLATTFNNSQIINANVNIPSLYGNLDIIGDVAILINSDEIDSTSVVWVSNLIAQLATDTPESVSGVSSYNGTFTSIRTENNSDSTELKIQADSLTIDGIAGFTGSFTAGGQTVTVTKGIITSVV
ncbi:MAG: hypothetical protein WD512_13275 [Candidatus Paceibacterota bacterium]